MLQAAGINKDLSRKFFACLFCQREDDPKFPYNQSHHSTRTPKDPFCSAFSSFPATQIDVSERKSEGAFEENRTFVVSRSLTVQLIKLPSTN